MDRSIGVLPFLARDKHRNPRMPWLGRVDGGLTEYLERLITVVDVIQNVIFPTSQMWWAPCGIL